MDADSNDTVYAMLIIIIDCNRCYLTQPANHNKWLCLIEPLNAVFNAITLNKIELHIAQHCFQLSLGSPMHWHIAIRDTNRKCGASLPHSENPIAVQDN